MKLNISIGNTELSGYTNIDVATAKIDMGNLAETCGEAECTDIIVDDVMRFMPHQKIPLVIEHIVSRLRHKGTLTFIFPDLNGVVRSYQNAEIDEEKFNQILFGLGTKSCFSYQYIINTVNTLNLQVKSIDISSEQTIITIERP